MRGGLRMRSLSLEVKSEHYYALRSDWYCGFVLEVGTFCEIASLSSVGSPKMTCLGKTIPKSFAFSMPTPLTLHQHGTDEKTRRKRRERYLLREMGGRDE
jgi:hypothetical protein